MNCGGSRIIDVQDGMWMLEWVLSTPENTKILSADNIDG
jgi:hypothetical protein